MFKKRIITVLSIGMLLIITGCIVSPALQDYHYDVSEGYVLMRASPNIIVIQPKERSEEYRVRIEAKVAEICWDERYTIVKQYELDANKKPDPERMNLWILDAQEHVLHGPFNEEELAEKRKELNISEDLVLKDVDDYPRAETVWPEE